ncbi:NAD-binding protein [Candidatus Nitrosopumilus salaria BD31]|uniref:NAD-binding protein n=1 Tax=Candidatus Nitrosopumilus salarius BD31 TaxID=859350 RepID=I3D599_9ARCH|nr:SDR family NAD(P)-dependent oxidoreductase [Candidatus Nitrosopumilus salaria]EIJ66892.1 NAD-binding protein [Candidatus Nitrosopumilus salaria BD31]
MRIFITGGSGFIGSHLSDELLKENHEITLIVRNLNKEKNISKNSSKINIVQIDVTDTVSLEQYIKEKKPDVIFHLAGTTSHKHSFENPLYDIDVNIKSTMCILESIRQHVPNCKLILGSTFIVIGKPERLPVTEGSKCDPTTIYGANRLTSEHLCKIYHNMYGLDSMSFRITNCYGPREQVISDKNAINYLIYKAFNGEKITLFNKGQFYRDLIYVSDVISALKVIMKKGKSGNLYWISSGKKTWFYKFGNLLTKQTGTKVIFTPTPKYTKKVDVGNFVANNTKLQKLGWKPKVSLESGIMKTLDYFKSQK